MQSLEYWIINPKNFFSSNQNMMVFFYSVPMFIHWHIGWFTSSKPVYLLIIGSRNYIIVKTLINIIYCFICISSTRSNTGPCIRLNLKIGLPPAQAIHCLIWIIKIISCKWFTCFKCIYRADEIFNCNY